jgi:SAM-dependent methyltransferase
LDVKTLVKSMIPPSLRDIVHAGRLYARRPEIYFASGPSFTCPLCRYTGKFLDEHASYGNRKYVICPRCGSRERHRLQYCVLEELFATYPVHGQAALHFSPERPILKYLRPRFAKYTTADIDPRRADVQADLRKLPFDDNSYDFVYASHVLEHVDDDRRALAEIVRVLRPGGVAILPVPIFGDTTIEYPHVVPTEEYHVRAPGRDYFDRYRDVFARVDVKSSSAYPAEYQLYMYEDRSMYPTKNCPFKRPEFGERHVDFVPVAYR